MAPSNISISDLPDTVVGEVTSEGHEVTGLTLDTSLFASTSPEEAIFEIVSVLIHEVVHTHQVTDQRRELSERQQFLNEMEAAMLEIVILDKLYLAGVIDD